MDDDIELNVDEGSVLVRTNTANTISTVSILLFLVH